MNDKISAVILTKNEEYYIRNCLENLKSFDEIIVVDDYSTDRTLEICKEFSNKIFQKKLIDFSEQRNFAFAQAKNNWILFIDADEQISPELVSEIHDLKLNITPYAGFYINYKTMFIGKWLRYGGWYPEYHLRLFRKDKAKCVGAVHEDIELDGKTAFLKNEVIHFSEINIEHRIQKTNIYTSLAAKEKFKSGAKTSWIKVLFRPIKTFFNRYFRLQGFRDGMHGFVRALLLAVTSLFEEVKLWELYLNKRKDKED